MISNFWSTAHPYWFIQGMFTVEIRVVDPDCLTGSRIQKRPNSDSADSLGASRISQLEIKDKLYIRAKGLTNKEKDEHMKKLTFRTSIQTYKRIKKFAILHKNDSL